MFMIISVKVDTQAAGGLSISASASQVSAGGTFTVTVKGASNYFVADIKLSVSGGEVVSGLGETSLDKGEKTTAKIKLTGDTCKVSVSGVGANYDTVTEGTASASVTVKKKVVVADNRSKDNTLASLSVSEGTLSPEFNAATTEYNVALGGTTEKIILSANANDAKATVSGTGEKTVVPGQNRFVIVCTAENKKQKEYVVNVHVDESPIVFTTYNEQKLGVVRNQTNIGIPASFEQTTVTLDGQEVQAYYSNQFDMTLVYLVDESGNKDFYIYKAEQGITSVFRPVSILGRNVIVYDLTEEEQVRENMVYSEVTVDGITLYGWTYENPDFKNYIHILVMNEFGQKVEYQYETTENSLQLYREYVEIEEEEETIGNAFAEIKPWNFLEPYLSQYYEYIIFGLVGLVLILITVVIILAVKKKVPKEALEQKQGIPAVCEAKEDVKEKKPKKEKKKKQEPETPALDPVKGVPELQKKKKVKEPKVKLTKEEKRAAKAEAKKEKKHTKRMKRQKRRQAKHKEDL